MTLLHTPQMRLFFGGVRKKVIRLISIETCIFFLRGSNISPPKNIFESMIFLFPFGGICWFLGRVNNVTSWTLKKPEVLYETTKTTGEELTDPARKDGKTATLRLKVTPEFGFLRSMKFFFSKLSLGWHFLTSNDVRFFFEALSVGFLT